MFQNLWELPPNIASILNNSELLITQTVQKRKDSEQLCTT